MAATFNAFVKKFPELTLPVTLTEDSASIFSKENDPLPVQMIQDHIVPYELEEYDDLTEYIVCFRIANLKDFHAIVYWRAGLLNYQYVLMTFDKSGKVIDRRTIAGTFSDGKTVTYSMARIDDDMTIYIVSGQTSDTAGLYDATQSKGIELELMPDGKIIEM